MQPLDEPLVLGILYQCAAGVRHLHTAAKLVHRDIRADNFLVAFLQPLRVLITDFGLSHQMTDAAGTSASTSFTLIGPVGKPLALPTVLKCIGYYRLTPASLCRASYPAG